jgi:cobalt-zinc-cadmium efflux system protein
MDGHAHDHGAGRSRDRRALRWALALTAAFCVVEFVGGWLTNSLALLSDAVHMLTDVAALALALMALWVAARPPSDSKTFGYHRAEILAALANGVLLGLAVLFILREAWERLQSPTPVDTGGLMLVAGLGLVVNVICARLLSPGQGDSLNRRAAFLHVLSDLLGSLGALLAGVVIALTGWQQADALAAALISVLILVNAWRLVRESLDILMEAVPSHIDLEELRRAMEEVPGCCRVHDLHVWTLTTGRHALAAHAVVEESADGEAVLEALQALLAARFDVQHVTIQLECSRPCAPASVHA